jgi:3-deoxy-manno-octulosonate cytidylyltransferase (CMP-KDO synthetase)
MNGYGSVAIIPARYNSSRLPGKPLIEVDGRTLIEHVYRRVESVPGLERIVVATDDLRIQKAVEAFGGHAVLTRRDHPSGTDRIAEAAKELDDRTIVLNVQGDEPLIEPEVLECALSAARTRDTDVVTLMSPLSAPKAVADPNKVKVVVDRNGFAMYFSRSPIPSSGPYFLHLGSYAYTAGFLRAFTELPVTALERAERLEQLRILEHGYRIRVVEVKSNSFGIDTPADLEAFRDLIERGRMKSASNG